MFKPVFNNCGASLYVTTKLKSLFSFEPVCNHVGFCIIVINVDSVKPETGSGFYNTREKLLSQSSVPSVLRII